MMAINLDVYDGSIRSLLLLLLLLRRCCCVAVSVVVDLFVGVDQRRCAGCQVLLAAKSETAFLVGLSRLLNRQRLAFFVSAKMPMNCC